MKWTHATGLLATCSMIAAGGIWAGCSSNPSGNDGGTNDGGGNDVQQQQDTGTKDTGTSDTGTNDGGTGVDGSVLDCTYYCNNIMTVCNGTNGPQQYLDTATCMTMCTDGIPNDAGAGAQGGDSLACRMYHLSVAATTPANAQTHCPHAGPYGFGVCGDLCNDFCTMYFAGPCKTDTTTGYTNLAACETYCPTAAGSDAGTGSPGVAATTPTMACKEYHLENGYKTDGGGGHCDHAGLSGAGVCN